MNDYHIKTTINDCQLEIDNSFDSDYPGIDIEFNPKDYNNLPENQQGTKSRILIEWPKNEPHPRVLIWADANQEDYTHCIPLTNIKGKRN